MSWNESSIKKNIFKFCIVGICSIIIMGFVAYITRNYMLNVIMQYAENQARERAVDAQRRIEERFSREFFELEEVARRYSDSVFSEAFIEKLNNDKVSGIEFGVVDINGKQTIGENAKLLPLSSLNENLRGGRSISYIKDKGVLLSVPVMNGSNVRYVLYCVFSNKYIPKFFETNLMHSGSVTWMKDNEDNLIYVPDEIKDNMNNLLHLDFNDNSKLSQLNGESVDLQRINDSIYGDIFVFGSSSESLKFGIYGFIPAKSIVDPLLKMDSFISGVLLVFVFVFCIIAIYTYTTRQMLGKGDDLAHERDEAERASKAKSDFLANMSHEIRTPINAIIGMNEMIRRKSSNAEISSFSANIERASKNLLNLVNDILDFSKIEAGKMDIVIVDYDTKLLFLDVVDMVSMKANAKMIKLDIDIAPNIPRKLRGDEQRLRQICINILNNSVKYTQKGSILFRAKMEELVPGQVNLTISVKDTGIGISKENLQKLFKTFERFDMERNRSIEGTGLGLSIVKKLIDLMGGTINVNSVYGVGSEFIITIPQNVVDSTPIGDVKAEEELQEEEEYSSSFTAPSARVLIVDDNEMNLMVAEGLLESTNLQVDTCTSGTECMKLVTIKKYDVIMLDHMMPPPDGIETLGLMKKMPDNLCKESPVIALTANAVVGAKNMYIEKGFDDYLSKPIDSVLLEKMLIKHLPKEKVVLGGAPIKKSDDDVKVETSEKDSAKTKVSVKASETAKPTTTTKSSPSSASSVANKSNSAPVQAKKSSIKPIQENSVLPAKVVGCIDIGAAAKTCPSKSMYLKIIEIFIKNEKQFTAKFEQSLKDGNWENYVSTISTLKGNMLGIGCTSEIITLAEKLEVASRAVIKGNMKDENIDYIIMNGPEFLTAYRKAIADACIVMNELGN